MSTTVTPSMGWFRKSPKTHHEVVQVRAQVDWLRAAIDRQDHRTTTLSNALARQPDLPGLVKRVDELDQSLAARADEGELVARLDAMAGRLSALDGMAEQIAKLDDRITSVSTELANQISELGTDIDALQKRPPGEQVAEEVLDGLRDGQERLANEQARYQIAFRDDLAKLAEQLKRPRA